MSTPAPCEGLSQPIHLLSVAFQLFSFSALSRETKNAEIAFQRIRRNTVLQK